MPYGMGYFYGAPRGTRVSRVKVPNPPGSGKDIAEGKGVEDNLESEGSRMRVTSMDGSITEYVCAYGNNGNYPKRKYAVHGWIFRWEQRQEEHDKTMGGKYKNEKKY